MLSVCLLCSKASKGFDFHLFKINIVLFALKNEKKKEFPLLTLKLSLVLSGYLKRLMGFLQHARFVSVPFNIYGENRNTGEKDLCWLGRKAWDLKGNEYLLYEAQSRS